MSEKQKLSLMVGLLIKPPVSAGNLLQPLLRKNHFQNLKLLHSIDA